MSESEWSGRYRLLGALGEGGQGKVYLAEDPQGVRVAVKLLHPGLAADEPARRRFLREAELARRVAPFCTARVLDAGIADGRPYIVSEYVPGVSLEKLVAAEGPRTGSSLDRLAVSTLTALAAIHRAGIVHRDFKPGNVLLGPEGPVVIDFGIARAAEQSTTRSGLVGTPAYMAPEQFDGVPASAASDLFAWAATMVFAATGRRAFPGATPAAVMHAIFTKPPDLTGVPPELAPLLAACLAKRPEDRPSAAEVLGRLTGESAAPRPPSASPPVPALDGPPPMPTLREPPPVPYGPPPERPRPFVLASLVQIAVGIATMAVLLWDEEHWPGKWENPVFWAALALWPVAGGLVVLRLRRGGHAAEDADAESAAGGGRR